MLDSTRHILSDAGFMPHGMCYLWRPDVLSLHVASDALIALAYFSIPFTLLYFVRKRRDLKFQWMFVCFAIFIVACGATHLMEIWVIWHPVYWVSGSIKAITALASVPTAILLVRLIPQALRLPSPLALERANEDLQREVAERKRAESEIRGLNDALEARVTERTQQVQAANLELQREIRERQSVEQGLRESEGRMRAVLESALSAVIVINAQGKIIDWNPRAERMFGWTRGEVLDRELAETIIPVQHRDAHRRGLSHFLSTGEGPVLYRLLEMSAVHRDGTELPVELSISPLKSGDVITFCGFLTDITERKRAEEAARSSQKLLQAVIDNSMAVVYVKDVEGHYLLVNRRYEELFHLTRDWIVGKTDFDIFPKESAEAFRAVDQEVLAAGTALQREEIVPQDDGPHTYVSGKCPLLDDTGKIYAICGISTDITERKRHEAQRAQYAAIVESSDDAIMAKTPQGVITSWNRGAERLFGYAAAEMVGQPILTLFPEGQRDEEADILEKIARGASVDHFETVRVRKDGTRVDVSVTISPIRNDHGDIVGASKIARDISERKQGERNLQMHLVRLELLGLITRAIGLRQDLASIFQVVIGSLENSLPIDFGCVCLYDSIGDALTVTRVGPASEALALELGLPEKAPIAIDQNGLARCVGGQLVYEPDVGQVQFPFPQQLARGGLCALVAAPLLVESRVFGVLIAARRAPNSFSSGECEFLRQLTEHVALAANQAETHGALRRAYDDLRQTQQAILQQERLRALGEMASGIAHDINNALSPVALYTDALLEREQHLSVQGRGYLQVIQRAIDDVAQTVARMREFYRHREPQLALAPIQMNQLVEQVIDLTRARWSDMPQQRGVVIEMQHELAPDLPTVMGVESEVREALTNLIFNAIDAMPDGGLMTLRTGIATADTSIYVEVCDNGIGMDEDTRRRCLEPFFTTKGERGTGLGLAMVYGMVKRHSADIDIRSTVGDGTTVRLSFSCQSASIPLAGESAAVVPALPRLRILVVDDDPLLLKSLRDILEGDGHEVTTANGGQEGIDGFHAALQRGAAFAVVISDLGMPYIDGRKVASAIKNLSPSTPVILLTGWGQRLIAEGDVPAYVDRVLSKPPKLKQLREALLACLVSAEH
jgi:PAS domain S-box-containing protein